MMQVELMVAASLSAAVFPLLINIAQCYRAILNDAKIVSLDPALRSPIEVLFAYPGFWALFWYRLSHALWQRRIPLVSDVWPRLTMAIVRCATAIDIHPEAQISSEGILIDHGAGLVVGAHAIIGGGVTLYHGVTLGGTGKRLPAGAKRHPTIGDRVVVGAGAKILGDIVIGNDVLVGANSVVTKPVPANHTAVGIPARVLCHGSSVGKDVTGAAICELHQRLQKVERQNSDQAKSEPIVSSKSKVVVESTAPHLASEKSNMFKEKYLPVAVLTAAATTTPSVYATPARSNAGARMEIGRGEEQSVDQSGERSAERRVQSSAKSPVTEAVEQPAGGNREAEKFSDLPVTASGVDHEERSTKRSAERSSSFDANKDGVRSPTTVTLLAHEEGAPKSSPTSSLIPSRFAVQKQGYLYQERSHPFTGKIYNSPVSASPSRGWRVGQASRPQWGPDEKGRSSAIDEIMYGLRAVEEEPVGGDEGEE